MIFSAVNKYGWSCMANFVYWNILRWENLGFFDVKDTSFTVATLDPMLTIISIDFYTRMQQQENHMMIVA